MYRVHFLSDSRSFNNQLKREPYPMPNTNNILFTLEGFKYETSLDLIME